MNHMKLINNIKIQIFIRFYKFKTLNIKKNLFVKLRNMNKLLKNVKLSVITSIIYRPLSILHKDTKSNKSNRLYDLLGYG